MKQTYIASSDDERFECEFEIDRDIFPPPEELRKIINVNTSSMNDGQVFDLMIRYIAREVFCYYIQGYYLEEVMDLIAEIDGLIAIDGRFGIELKNCYGNQIDAENITVHIKNGDWYGYRL